MQPNRDTYMEFAFARFKGGAYVGLDDVIELLEFLEQHRIANQLLRAYHRSMG